MISLVEAPNIAAAMAEVALVEWAVKYSSVPAFWRDFLIQQAVEDDVSGLCGGGHLHSVSSQLAYDAVIYMLLDTIVCL